MKYTRHTLKNGLRLITVPMKDTGTVTVMIMVETGSKYEDKMTNGLSHFLEHMCFKGTLKRPSAFHITKELDGLGAQSNAFTGEEYTGYYAKGDAKHVDKYFDIIADVYMNSTFPKEEIEKERGVIIEEINMYEDMSRRQVFNIFTELMYKDQPAGMPIIGPKENIKRFVRDDFETYHKKHYIASNTAIFVAGNIDPKRIKKLVESEFGSLAKKPKTKKVKVNDSQKAPGFVYKVKKQDQTNLVLGVRTYPYGDKKNPAISVLCAILAGGMSSRLFQKLREEMGVCYYVKSYNETQTDHGVCMVTCGVDPKRTAEVVGVIKSELWRLKDELVSDEELKRAKEYMIGNMKIELESSDSFAHFYAGQEIMNKKLQSPKDIEKEIRSVTAKSIQKVANKIFVDTTLNLAIIGPDTDKEKIRKLLVS